MTFWFSFVLGLKVPEGQAFVFLNLPQPQERREAGQRLSEPPDCHVRHRSPSPRGRCPRAASTDSSPANAQPRASANAAALRLEVGKGRLCSWGGGERWEPSCSEGPLAGSQLLPLSWLPSRCIELVLPRPYF